MGRRILFRSILVAIAALLAVRSAAVHAQFFAAPAPDSHVASSQKTVQDGLYMTGYGTTFEGNYSSVTLTVPAVRNDSFTRTTGSLRFEYWVTTIPPTARGLSFASGYLLSRFPNLAALAPRTSHANVAQTTTVTVPPDGTYWFVLLLEEYDPANCSAPDGFCVVDSLTGTQRTFGAGAANYPLTVTLAGSGSGTVASTISGINCPGTCSATFSSPAAITLTATPAAGSSFQGWGGACSGTGNCTVTMNQARDVSATFSSTSVSTANYSDIWWNASESGWGLTLADHESILFGVWYTYNSSGAPIWYVLTSGAYSQGKRLWSGEVWQTTGPGYASPRFDTNQVTSSRVGSASLDFAPPGAAPGVTSFSYTIGSVTRTKQVTRQPFGSANPSWGADVTDIWWNRDESGWGITLAQHGNNTFGVLYTYDANRQPLWVVMPGVTHQSATLFTGALYTTTGPEFGAASFDPSRVRSTAVGSAQFYLSETGGSFAYTINGATNAKSISRQPFGQGAPVSTFSRSAFAFKGSVGALGSVRYTDKRGRQVDVPAFPGQVQVYWDPASPVTPSVFVQQNGGQIISQIPRLGYYLIAVAPGQEGAFIRAAEGVSTLAIPNIAVVPSLVDLSDILGPAGELPTVPNLRAQVGSGTYLYGVDHFLVPSSCGMTHGDATSIVSNRNLAGTGQQINIARRDGSLTPASDLAASSDLAIADMTFNGTGRAIVNMSLQGSVSADPNTYYAAEVAFLWSKAAELNNLAANAPAAFAQTLYVISAGNGVGNTGTAGVDLTADIQALRAAFPRVFGTRPHMIIVGGATAGGGIDTGFNYSTIPGDVFYAPGRNVPITGGCASDGTSFSAPTVSNLLARTLAAHRDWTIEETTDAFRRAYLANGNSLPTQAQIEAAHGGSPLCLFQYSDWGSCQANNTQTRNEISRTPTGCSGTPVLTQSCLYNAPMCTYIYSDWGACQPNNTQSRTVISSSPAGCSGTPALTQACLYQGGGGGGVAGTWTGTWTRVLGGFGTATYTMRWSLSQSGSSVSGTYSYTMSSCDGLCGDSIGTTVNGTWFDGSYNGSTLTLRTTGGTTFAGAVSGNTVTGTSIGSFNGTFSMTKQ